MKKRICLLITLILSLFIFSGRVEAAKKMYCIYESGKFLDLAITSSTMLVQDSFGKISLYYNKKSGDFPYDDAGWYQVIDRNIVFESDYYDDKKKELNKCPNYYSFKTLTSEEIFHDEKLGGQENRVLIDYSEEDEKVDVNHTFTSPSNYQEQIQNTKWLGKCVYGYDDKTKLELYFNEDDYIIANYFSNHTESTFNCSELLKVVKDGNSCPPYLYMYTIQTTNALGHSSRTDKIYLYKKDMPTISGNMYGTTFTKTELPCIEGKVDIDFGNIEKPTLPIDDCKDLFGDDLVKQINKVMDVIKIAIPILLIGLGVLDFTKAVFAGNDDEMAKSKKTFFNRIIAAILVFIAPIFVNLILSLANNVWGYISPDTCINQKK